MKKILTIFTIFISLAGRAQINKGALQIGADVSYSQRKSQTGNFAASKSKSFGTDFAIGYAFAQNKTFGITAVYNKLSPLVFLTKGAGLFYRSYYPIGKSFLLYGEASAQYLSQENPSSGYYPGSSKAVQLALAPGIAYMPAKWIQFEAKVPNLLVFSYNKETNPSPNVTSSKTLNFNLLGQGESVAGLFSLGVNFNLNNR